MSMPQRAPKLGKCPNCGRHTINNYLNQHMMWFSGGLPRSQAEWEEDRRIHKEREEYEAYGKHLNLKKYIATHWAAWNAGTYRADCAPYLVKLGHGQEEQLTRTENCMICFMATPTGKAYAAFLNSLT
jgi:hypothetical protein